MKDRIFIIVNRNGIADTKKTDRFTLAPVKIPLVSFLVPAQALTQQVEVSVNPALEAE